MNDSRERGRLPRSLHMAPLGNQNNTLLLTTVGQWTVFWLAESSPSCPAKVLVKPSLPSQRVASCCHSPRVTTPFFLSPPLTHTQYISVSAACLSWFSPRLFISPTPKATGMGRGLWGVEHHQASPPGLLLLFPFTHQLLPLPL